VSGSNLVLAHSTLVVEIEGLDRGCTIRVEGLGF